MNTVVLPHPDEIIRRIDACEQELRSLKKLLRASRDFYDAEEARSRREPPLPQLEGVAHE